MQKELRPTFPGEEELSQSHWERAGLVTDLAIITGLTKPGWGDAPVLSSVHSHPYTLPLFGLPGGLCFLVSLRHSALSLFPRSSVWPTPTHQVTSDSSHVVSSQDTFFDSAHRLGSPHSVSLHSIPNPFLLQSALHSTVLFYGGICPLLAGKDFKGSLSSVNVVIEPNIIYWC